jgi:hypothetical protein
MSATVQAVEVGVTRSGKSARPFNYTLPANVAKDMLDLLTEQESAQCRTAVAKDITASGYDGTFEDDEEITFNPTAKNGTAVVSALNTLGLDVNPESAPAAEKTSSGKTAKTGVCEYTGLPTKGGRFLPGRDMSLRGALTKIVDNINLSDTDTVPVGEGTAVRQVGVQQAIDMLVAENWGYTREGLEQRRRKAFNNKAEVEARKAAAAAEREKAKAAKAAAAEAAETEDADEAEDVGDDES